MVQIFVIITHHRARESRPARAAPQEPPGGCICLLRRSARAPRGRHFVDLLQRLPPEELGRRLSGHLRATFSARQLPGAATRRSREILSQKQRQKQHRLWGQTLLRLEGGPLGRDGEGGKIIVARLGPSGGGDGGGGSDGSPATTTRRRRTKSRRASWPLVAHSKGPPPGSAENNRPALAGGAHSNGRYLAALWHYSDR